MSEAYRSGRACGEIRSESGQAAALRAADWLCLAAAPTFAIMALLTGVLGGSQAAEHTSPLSGIIPIYLLMSAFHLLPWLKPIFQPRRKRSPRGLTPGGRYVVAVHRTTVRAMAFDRQHAVGEVQARIGTGETHGQEHGGRHAA